MITMAYLLLCNNLPTESYFGDEDVVDIRLFIAYIISLNSEKKKDSDVVRLIVQLNDYDDNNEIFSCMVGN
jgi:hypothetical protein